MPKVLRDFLDSLKGQIADDVWLWLDGNPEAISEMIAVIASNTENKPK